LLTRSRRARANGDVYDQRPLKGNNDVTFPMRIQTPIDAMYYKTLKLGTL